MAAAKQKNNYVTDGGTLIQYVTLSEMTDAQAETITLKGPSGVTPSFVSFCFDTQPSSDEVVQGYWTASDVASDPNTITVEVQIETAGTITGLTCIVRIEWSSAGSGGIS